MNRNYKIAVVNGDGIGKEIVPAGWSVLTAAAERFGFGLASQLYDWGAGYYLKHKKFMPDDGVELLKKYDAIYFGAVGLPEVDDTLPAKDYTFKVRTELEQYINYRPVKLFSGIPSPLKDKKAEDIDFVIIRENNEGEFVQNGKILYGDKPYGLATDTSVFTRQGIERVARYSFQLARQRKGKVTNVTKSNTLINSLLYWDRVIAEVAEEYSDVAYEKMYVDNAAATFVLKPEQFDVILTTNMIGDILSDLGGAIMGSLGLGGSGNINPDRKYPSMFEPIHGSAPDIAGQNKANPLGQIWAGALMLEHLGEKQAANAIMESVNAVTGAGHLTLDLRGSCTTSDMADRVIENLQKIEKTIL